MGHKRITEKDFWICSEGNVPAQLQSTQKSTKKSSGEKYITVKDTSTSSWIDFGCKKAMLIYAIIAAAVVVIAAMTVATGGAALIALGALAGLAGAAWGAVIGALLCGQTAAKGRTWIEVPKARMTSIQGVRQITGDCTMTCMVGGTISFAPEIKSWSQAVSLGAANYIGGLMEGMMAGAAIGMGGAAISGGAGAFGAGGMRGLGQAALQFAKSAPMNVLRNIGASFGYAGVGASTSAVTTTIGAAVGLRGLTSAQAGLQHYGSTGESGWGAAGKGVVGMETGMYHSVKNLTTFHNPETGAFEWQGTWQDVTGLALLLSPVHKAAEEVNGKKPKGEEPVQDGEGKKPDEETVKDTHVKNEEPAKQEGEHETFEDPEIISNKIKGDLGEAKVIAKLKADGYTEVVQVQNNSGHGVDVIARDPISGNVKCIEVKANSSQLSEAQKMGGEKYVEDRLNRAVEGNGHYKIPPNSEQMKLDAEKAQKWLEDAEKIDYEVHQVPVDNTTGVTGDPKVTQWDPKPPKVPKTPKVPKPKK